MKKIVFLLLLIFAGTQLSNKLNAQTNEVKHKVVIQLNTADTAAWSSTIGNIKNLQKILMKILISLWLVKLQMTY